MEIESLLKKPLPQIPIDIVEKINNEKISLTQFNEKNNILENKDFQQEIGFGRFHNGDYLISMTCPMPGITSEMIEWWFWWHPQEKIRYQVWFPGEHYGISYAKKNKEYFLKTNRPDFATNCQYPVERIGKIKIPLLIEFVTATEFGFNKAFMKQASIPLIVCGHVGAFKGILMHTEMAHIFKQTNDGLFLISRFWLGITLKPGFLRKAILNDENARVMAEHCFMEYRNLVEILPSLYYKYHNV